MNKITIPYKFVSLNEYINACRSNKHAGATMKAQIEQDIGWYIKLLPKYEKPVKIVFRWFEGNGKRDIDNVAFSKKFILDTMVKCGVLTNDTRQYVTSFVDEFPPVGKEWKVEIEIEEVN